MSTITRIDDARTRHKAVCQKCRKVMSSGWIIDEVEFQDESVVLCDLCTGRLFVDLHHQACENPDWAKAVVKILETYKF